MVVIMWLRVKGFALEGRVSLYRVVCATSFLYFFVTDAFFLCVPEVMTASTSPGFGVGETLSLVSKTRCHIVPDLITFDTGAV